MPDFPRLFPSSSISSIFSISSISPFSVWLLCRLVVYLLKYLKQLPELITYPYRYQSYTRAREFRNFHDKLATTLQRATHSVEFAMQQLFIQNAFSSPASALTVLTPYIPKVLHSGMSLLPSFSLPLPPPSSFPFRFVSWPVFHSLWCSFSLRTNWGIGGGKTEEQLKELYETADNSFVDGWHNLLDLSSDYTGNSASNLFSFQQKVDFVGFRGASFHLLVAILKGSDAESISKLFSSFTDSYAKLKFDGSTSPIWTLYFNLFKYSTSFLSFLFTLKGSPPPFPLLPFLFPFLTHFPNIQKRQMLRKLMFQTRSRGTCSLLSLPVFIPFFIFILPLPWFSRNQGITERVKELVNNQSPYFAVDALPLCSLYVSVLSWSYLLFTTINPLIPKRLPKKANQTTKNLVKFRFLQLFIFLTFTS